MTRSASSGTWSGRRTKPSSGLQEQAFGPVAGGEQRGLGLGELRVHDERRAAAAKARATRVNASAPPAVGSTWSRSTSCAAAIALHASSVRG